MFPRRRPRPAPPPAPEPAPARPVRPDAGGPSAIEVRGLVKRFDAFTAVAGIDLDVAPGEVFGFLGPNGCGKTTTIRILTGTLAPTDGTAAVLGEDVVAHPDRVQRRIGYMSQRFSLFEDLTVEENLRFYAGVYDVPPDVAAQRREEILAMSGLAGRQDELTAHLSVGVRQRLSLGVATIHGPELLFLDEPTSGVDPVARRQFWDLLYGLAQDGVTLFVTTHYMEEASNCGRLALMYGGRVIAQGTPRELRGLRPGHPDLESVFVDLVQAQRQSPGA